MLIASKYLPDARNRSELRPPYSQHRWAGPGQVPRRYTPQRRAHPRVFESSRETNRKILGCVSQEHGSHRRKLVDDRETEIIHRAGVGFFKVGYSHGDLPGRFSGQLFRYLDSDPR